jgi:hypothetical protein
MRQQRGTGKYSDMETSVGRKVIKFGTATLLALITIVIFTNLGAAKMTRQKQLEIWIGESGKSFASRVADSIDLNREPAGLDFYTIRWPSADLGSVTVKQGQTRLQFDNVLRITAVENDDYPGEGLSTIDISMTITSDDTIAHDEARVKFMHILQKILGSGWKSTIPRSKPRLRGKDMNNYMLETGKSTTLDPSYIPTLDEWMRYKDLTEWAFYQEQAFLSIQISRHHKMLDVQKPGVYLITVHLESEAKYFRAYVDQSDRQHWREMLKEEIVKLTGWRTKLEKEYSKRGIAIDQTYIDPPIPREN